MGGRRIEISEADLGLAEAPTANLPVAAPAPALPATAHTAQTAVWQPPVGPPAPPTGLQPGAGPSGGRRRWLPWAIGGAVLALVATIGLVFALTRGPGADETYTAAVQETLAPVAESDGQVKSALMALDGPDRSSARAAVGSAQDTVDDARSGLGDLETPDGAEATLGDARQVLSREVAYLSAVDRVLKDPGNSSARNQVPTLESALSNALEDAEPAEEDWAGEVGGGVELVSWANSRVRARERAAAQARERQREQEAEDAANRAAAAASAAAASAPSDCGGGVSAGPNTSCAFALNVRDAYYDVPGSSTTVNVYSPTTSQTYSMYCTPVGGQVRCTGGNNSSVTF
jgi:hypothetical protein